MSTRVHRGDEHNAAEPLPVTTTYTKEKKNVLVKMLAFVEVGTWDRRSNCLHPRKSNFVVHVAKRSSTLQGVGTIDCSRCDRHGRLGQTREESEGVQKADILSSIFCCTDGGSARRRTRRAVKRHSHQSQLGMCHWFTLGEQASRCLQRNRDDGSTFTTVRFVENNAASSGNRFLAHQKLHGARLGRSEKHHD